MGLLRSLIVAFPGQYGDLGLLVEEDAELDFFNNVAHLQLHRRQRALQRLTKVCPACWPLAMVLMICFGSARHGLCCRCTMLGRLWCWIA